MTNIKKTLEETLAIPFVSRGSRTKEIYEDLVGIVLRSGIEHGASLYRALQEGKPGAAIEQKNRLRPFIDRFGQFVVKEDPHTKQIIGTKVGGMYYTTDQTEPMMFEHVSPITSASDAYLKGEITVRDLLFNPVCLVGSVTNKECLGGQHVVGGYDQERPFTRYVRSGLHLKTKIYTWSGMEVDPLSWSWKDHVEHVITPHEIWNHLYRNVLR